MKISEKGEGNHNKFAEFNTLLEISFRALSSGEDLM